MIKFNQPRYILPLIVLPFIYVFFYMYESSNADELHAEFSPETAPVATSVQAINPALPEPFLDEGHLKDKFDAYQEAHKYRRDFSAMQEITQEASPQHQRSAHPPGAASAEIPHEQVATQRTSIPSGSRQQDFTAYDEQMRLFKAQMGFVDSLIRSEEEIKKRGALPTQAADSISNTGQSPTPQAASIFEKARKSRPQGHSSPLHAEKQHGMQSEHFNTIMTRTTDHTIKAIVDEALTVIRGSRIRLRLLEDVRIGEHMLPKGQYLYGRISAFKPQRIEIQISSLLLEGQLIEVALDIYDLDGLKGLYVPKSNFRELAKAVGENITSGQQLPLDQPPDNQMQLMYGLAKDAFNTTTRAASKAIRRNKARLKYNTMVYLVNANTLTSSSNNPL